MSNIETIRGALGSVEGLGFYIRQTEFQAHGLSYSAHFSGGFRVQSELRWALDTASVRVLVVDDYEPWHGFVSTTFQKQHELEIIGRVSDGLEAVQKAQQLQPDLILLDIGLPTLNGLEAAKRIRQCAPKSKILFVSENRSPDVAQEALDNGAGGYVVKSDAARELLPAVKAVLEGKRFISTALAGHFLVATTLTTTQTMLSWMVTLISGIR